MGYNTFEALPKEKKEIILKTCIEEFSEFGYDNASTNRIVKRINLSKGSLFKYFHSKEELYIYIIDHVTSEITSEVTKNISNLPSDIFERLYMLAEIEFDLYVKNPITYKLFKEAFAGKSDMSQKLIEKYSIQSDSYFDYIFQEAEFSNGKYGKGKILNLIKWVLIGYNEHFTEANFHTMTDVAEFKRKYLEGIQMYITMIRQGVDR